MSARKLVSLFSFATAVFLAPTLAIAQSSNSDQDRDAEITVGAQLQGIVQIPEPGLGLELGLDLSANNYRAGVFMGFMSDASLFDSRSSLRVGAGISRRFPMARGMFSTRAELAGGYSTVEFETEEASIFADEPEAGSESRLFLRVGAGMEVGEEDGIAFQMGIRANLYYQLSAEGDGVNNPLLTGAFEFHSGVRVGF